MRFGVRHSSLPQRAVLLLGVGASFLLSSIAAAQSLSILNAGFEDDFPVSSPPSFWTASAGTMYVTSGAGLSPIDPTSAYSGNNFVTANRLATDPDSTFPAGQTMSIFQNISVSEYAAAIDSAGRYIQLSFAYNDADPDDNGIVAMTFLDDSALQIGNSLQFHTNNQPTANNAWATASLQGSVPFGTRSVQISLTGERPVGSSTARNVSFDALAAQLLDSAPPIAPRDVVHGNLVQFNDNGAWSWFQDERAIVDTSRGKLVVGSIANRSGEGGQTADGWVRSTMFDLGTGARTTSQLKDLESYGAGDDHNVPGYLQLPNGNYLAFYAPHNNISNNGANGADGGGNIERYSSFYRTYDVATETWGPEHEYNWQNVIPANAPGAGGTTYSNLFNLSAENNGNGRIYNIARTQQSPHIMYSDDSGETWTYGGQLTKQAAGAPANSYVNGYFKYFSNGIDRIDFVATEFHPRDYNTSIYHGYIKNGKMYNSTGVEIDADIFDTQSSFDPNNVPAPDAFTQIFQAGSTSDSRAWMSDIQTYPDGSVSVLFKARAGGYASHTVGADDQRVWFSRFDPQANQWTTSQIAKAGGQLFPGNETDYTGLGALDPNDPNTIYISTNVDPTSDASLARHEIYKGVTNNHGQNWNWTAITENSTYENLRPIIPKWDDQNTAVLWWRGTMSSSQNYDAAVVGILDRRAEHSNSVVYVDATTSNTTLANGSPLTLTGPSAAAGPADGNWHLRNGVGNGNGVLTADESGAENVPTIRTTVSGVDPGTYDLFVFFWNDLNQDWRLEAGLAEDNLMVFRARGSQQADAEQFGVVPILDEENRSLYRGYLGRVDLSEGELINVFVNDSSGSGTKSVWYDGVGYARVAANSLIGDYNQDGTVDAADYTVWRNNLGTNNVLPNDPVGGTISDVQYNQWKSNFGRSSNEPAQSSSSPIPEPNSAVMLTSALVQLISWSCFRVGGLSGAHPSPVR